jgi:hypothetical protein
VAQWLLADRGFQKFHREVATERGRLAGMSPEERKTCKHTKNLMRHTRLAGISYRQFYLTSGTFCLFPSRKSDETKQNYINRHYDSWSISKYRESEVQTHISVKQCSTKSQNKNNMKIW